ncbi:hypothetical protein JIG36_28390 [Actinoplanes sp. LDG1-06]|uniref:Uncharacterized protein n=1 Tax=Paractinoplanes ovalisporus TaxID=2810368 RepID=A0ABS2AI12_9ACTN|nr:hypothetical protein [Actinoplanes ovalisporus]MBM2619479.1 hypothetical protein [Actinoplanes ovalisporus]
MTDDLGRLRQAMTDLAEHGGHADMYERTLRRSRRTQQRTRLATAGATAAAVVTIGGAIAYSSPDRPAPPVIPPATQTPAPSPSPSSAAPSETPTSSPPRSSAPTSHRPQYPDCPSAKTLEELTDLPEDWHFIPSSVSCWHNWATAAPKGPTPGDGIYLFHYRSGTGWRYHSQGSSFRCQDLGITTGNPPFCEMD